MQNSPAADPATAPEGQPAPEAFLGADERRLHSLRVFVADIETDHDSLYRPLHVVKMTGEFNMYDKNFVYCDKLTEQAVYFELNRLFNGVHGAELKKLGELKKSKGGKEVPFMTLKGIDRLFMLIGKDKKWFKVYRALGLATPRPATATATAAENAAAAENAPTEPSAGPMDSDDNSAGAGALGAKDGKDDDDEPSDDDGYGDDGWWMGGGGGVTTRTLVEETAITAKLEEQLVLARELTPFIEKQLILARELTPFIERQEQEKRLTIAAALAIDLARLKAGGEAKDADYARDLKKGWDSYEAEKETLELRNESAKAAIETDKVANAEEEKHRKRMFELEETFEEKKTKRARRGDDNEEDDGGSDSSEEEEYDDSAKLMTVAYGTTNQFDMSRADVARLSSGWVVTRGEFRVYNAKRIKDKLAAQMAAERAKLDAAVASAKGRR